MRIFQSDRSFLVQFISSHAPLLRGDLLDVGGKDGSRYRGFFPHAHSYRTLDPDASTHPDIVAGAEAIPLPDASVDGVLCVEVLMDIFRPDEAVREMARVLKPGGTLLLTASFMVALYNEPHNWWRFTPFVLERLLQPHFREVTVERRGGYFSLRVQQWIRYRIERHDLYHRRFLGACFSLISSLLGWWANLRDRWDSSPANRKFALGYNVVARK